MADQALLSVVVPLFNEEGNLPNLWGKLNELAGKLAADVSMEFVFVDDGSSDRTFAIASDLATQDSRITVLKFARNYGSHAAIAAGFSRCRGDCAMFLAGDMQDPPALIAELIQKWRAGTRIVWAARTSVDKQPLKDRLLSLTYWGLFNFAVDYPVPSGGVDFVLVDRVVVDIIRACAHERTPIFAQICQTGFAQGVVAYQKQARQAGRSGWTWKKKFGLVFQTLFFSVKPMRAMLLVAAFLTALAGGLSVVVTLRTFHASPVQLLMIIGSLFMHLGLLLFELSLAIFADHISQRLLSMEGHPRFVIEKSIEPPGVSSL